MLNNELREQLLECHRALTCWNDCSLDSGMFDPKFLAGLCGLYLGSRTKFSDQKHLPLLRPLILLHNKIVHDVDAKFFLV